MKILFDLKCNGLNVIGRLHHYLFVQRSCLIHGGKEQEPERFILAWNIWLLFEIFGNILLMFSILSQGCADINHSRNWNYLKLSRGPALCGPLSKVIFRTMESLRLLIVDWIIERNNLLWRFSNMKLSSVESRAQCLHYPAVMAYR